MSGDADAYNTEIQDYNFTVKNPFKPIEEMITHIKLFMAFFELQGNQGCYEDLVSKVLISRGKELKIEYPTDKYSEMVGNDVTCEGFWARPDEMWVTFFDHDGVEHNVEIWIDDIKYEKISRSGFPKKTQKYKKDSNSAGLLF
jgi:hypothetical protein